MLKTWEGGLWWVVKSGPTPRENPIKAGPVTWTHTGMMMKAGKIMHFKDSEILLPGMRKKPKVCDSVGFYIRPHHTRINAKRCLELDKWVWEHFKFSTPWSTHNLLRHYCRWFERQTAAAARWRVLKRNVLQMLAARSVNLTGPSDGPGQVQPFTQECTRSSLTSAGCVHIPEKKPLSII